MFFFLFYSHITCKQEEEVFLNNFLKCRALSLPLPYESMKGEYGEAENRRTERPKDLLGSKDCLNLKDLFFFFVLTRKMDVLC